MDAETYQEKFLEAYIEKPAKYKWYKDSFSKFKLNGVKNISWRWSWWAFGSGFWLLIYRKAYIYAFILFVLTIIFTIIPLGGLILMIAQGGLIPYFLYKDYLAKKSKIENTIKDKERRVEAMQKIGGCNSWAIVGYIIFNIFLLGYIVAAGAAFISMLQ